MSNGEWAQSRSPKSHSPPYFLSSAGHCSRCQGYSNKQNKVSILKEQKIDKLKKYMSEDLQVLWEKIREENKQVLRLWAYLNRPMGRPHWGTIWIWSWRRQGNQQWVWCGEQLCEAEVTADGEVLRQSRPGWRPAGVCYGWCLEGWQEGWGDKAQEMLRRLACDPCETLASIFAFVRWGAHLRGMVNVEWGVLTWWMAHREPQREADKYSQN